MVVNISSIFKLIFENCTSCVEVVAYILLKLLLKHMIHHNYDHCLPHDIQKLDMACLVCASGEEPTEEPPPEGPPRSVHITLSGFSLAPMEVNFGDLVCKFYQRNPNQRIRCSKEGCNICG